MQINKEFLDAELKSIRAQKAHFANLYQQASGAEEALLSLIQRAETDEPQPPKEGTANE